MQTESFFDKFGFQASQHEDGVKEYQLEMQDKFAIEDYYAMELDVSERRHKEHNDRCLHDG